MKKFSKMKMWKKVLIASLVLVILCGVLNVIMNFSSDIESSSFDADNYNFDSDSMTFSANSDIRSRNNSGKIIVNLIQVISTIVASITIYLVPTFVANDRKHKNKLAIILIDIFLGWSLIRLGWCFGMGLYCTKG